MTSRGKPRRRWRRKGLALALVLMAGFYLTRTVYYRFQKSYPATAFYTVKRADMLISIVEEGALRSLYETVDRSALEGFNRIIKQTKRVGCGYRNMDNYQRRILTHITVTRPQRSAA